MSSSSPIDPSSVNISGITFTANKFSDSFTGLTEYTTYYYAVFVKDPTGNVAYYPTASQKTLDATSPTPGGAISLVVSANETTLSVIYPQATDLDASLTFYVLLSSSAFSLTTPLTVSGGNVQATGVTTVYSGNYQSPVTINSLTAGNTYFVTVAVKDSANNWSLYTAASAIMDTIAPVVGTAPTFTGRGPKSVTVLWTAATDNHTAAAQLQYKLVQSSSSTQLTTFTGANQASLVMDWTTNVTTSTFNTSTNGVYYFAVLVKDLAGNTSLYSQSSVPLYYRVWLTATTYQGNFAGTPYGDNYNPQNPCKSSDANYPSPSGTFKPQRTICQAGSSCGSPSPGSYPASAVVAGNQYMRASDLTYVGVGESFWTGYFYQIRLNISTSLETTGRTYWSFYDTSNGNSCVSASTNSSGSFGANSNSGNTGPNFGNGGLTYSTCNNANAVLCVEQ